MSTTIPNLELINTALILTFFYWVVGLQLNLLVTELK